jgi:hypothetical protein
MFTYKMHFPNADKFKKKGLTHRLDKSNKISHYWLKHFF